MSQNDAEKTATSNAEDNSLSMRIAVRSLKVKWPRVKNVSTSQLHAWITKRVHDVVGDSVGSGSEAGCGGGVDVGSDTDASNARLIILDARESEEYSISHIAAARRVCPEGSDISATLRMLGEQSQDAKDHQVVVAYCSVGYRSSRYIQQLTQELSHCENEALKENLKMYNLEGSLFKWANESRPMVDDQGRKTVYVHPYSAVWGKLVKKELRQSELKS